MPKPCVLLWCTRVALLPRHVRPVHTYHPMIDIPPCTLRLESVTEMTTPLCCGAVVGVGSSSQLVALQHLLWVSAAVCGGWASFAIRFCHAGVKG